MKRQKLIKINTVFIIFLVFLLGVFTGELKNKNKFKKQTNAVSIKTVSSNVYNKHDFFNSFTKLVHNAFYFNLSDEYQREYHIQSLGMKIKIALHNSIFAQILLCLTTSIIFIWLLSKINTKNEILQELIIEKTQNQQINQENNDLNVIKEDDPNIIKLEDFKLQEFINKIKSEL